MLIKGGHLTEGSDAYQKQQEAWEGPQQVVTDVLFDGNSGIPSNHMYMLNTNYLQLVVHKDANLEIMEDVRPVNQDGSVTAIIWMGNLTCSNRKLQGVIIA